MMEQKDGEAVWQRIHLPHLCVSYLITLSVPKSQWTAAILWTPRDYVMKKDIYLIQTGMGWRIHIILSPCSDVQIKCWISNWPQSLWTLGIATYLVLTYRTSPLDSSPQSHWPWLDLLGHSWRLAVLDRGWECIWPAVCPLHMYTADSHLSMLNWPEDTVFIVRLWQEARHYQLLTAHQKVL